MRVLKFSMVMVGCFVSFGVMAQKSAQQPFSENGKKVYEQNCLACHQADGSGVPGLAPPLIKGTFVNGDKERLVDIVVRGMEGVEIKGEHYANPMPSFDYLNDQEIADLLTYVRSNFNNSAALVSVEEVNQVRKNP